MGSFARTSLKTPSFGSSLQCMFSFIITFSIFTIVQGDPGPKGVVGRAGVHGKDGENGLDGPQGDTGIQGPKVNPYLT